MPVCRLIPGMHEKDQCERMEGFWDNLDQESKDRCRQQTPCGPLRAGVVPLMPGGSRKATRKGNRKASRKGNHKSHRKGNRKASRKY